MNAKPILAYDTACAGASIALRVAGNTHTRALAQNEQASALVSTIDALLREHAVTYADLDCIVTTIGPGSFTGVRIGLAALHGFVLAAGAPIKLVSTLEAVAWHIASTADAPPQFYVTLRAGKGEVYAQSFANSHGQPIAQSDIFLASETKRDWDRPCFNDIIAPDAATLCNIADHLSTAALHAAMPLYIRDADAIAAAPHAWLTTS